MAERQTQADGRSLAVRFIHFGLLFTMAIAYGAGIFAFDFDTSMLIRTRDLLFNIHRLAGVLAGVLALLWMGVWSVGAIRNAANGHADVRLTWLGLYHAGLLIIGFLIPLLPWLARGQEGRWDELYVLVSPFNLVAHPTTDFAYLVRAEKPLN
ncbi:hypothetical protein TRICHSKD4_4683 [Roseibium sp. TrichSKD4]|uniref:hypothetical protein n=1 Tax=Roseibium sp. TrichSKD4 TaxID=744980 RepID=UPI0001E5775F|nr:hypothetical protein [Roseibium sp. TrichSKD4]EFO28871.1 hypothetical protein TRICHSKD4_4683 [Roseibium sp. TrichSKD4]